MSNVKKRKNIGFYIEETNNPISSGMCRGAMRAAMEFDVNLFIFPGSFWVGDEYYVNLDEASKRLEKQYNALYGMSSGFNLDAAVVTVNNICVDAKHESRDYLLSKLSGIPLVAIGEGTDLASVKFDNYSGIRDAVNYLVKEKGCTKIAFMAGDENNFDSILRLKAYKDAMIENGLPINNDYIGYGDFVKRVDKEMADLFNKAYDMEALVCACDRMALFAYEEAADRGIRVGTDLYIVGYDDIRECINANPPLATVRVDQERIGYEAVAACLKEGFIENKESLLIDTEFIPRESAGSKASGLADIITSLSMLNQNMTDKQNVCALLDEYVITSDERDYQAQCQKTVLHGFFDRLISHFFLDTIKRNSEEEIYNYFSDMIARNLLSYAEPRRLTDVFDVIYQSFCGKSRVLHNRMVLHTLISRMEHRVMEWVTENRARQEGRYGDMLHLTNEITRDVLNFDNEAEINYESAIKKLYNLDINHSVLLVYDNPICCEEPRKFVPPYSVLLKAYQDGKKVQRISRTKQKVVFNELAMNEAIDDGRRHTYMILDLFSKNDQLGLFMYDLTPENMIYREFLTYQISSAVKVIKLFNQHKEAMDSYNSLVERIKLNNEELLATSTIDDLSSIFNKRGFYEETEDLVLRKKDQGGYYVVAYADLDNLEKINNDFGHDEGDFVLKTVAEMLVSAFGEFAICGRIGGDEFAVVAYQKKSGFDKMYEDRFKMLLDKTNEKIDKPYKISVSMVVNEFETAEFSDIEAMVGQTKDALYE